MPLVVATPTAFLVSVVFNFTVNRLLATGGTPGGLGRQAFRYVVLLLGNLLFTTVLVVVGDRLGVPYLAAKGVAVVVSTAWNFLLYRRWVFADA